MLCELVLSFESEDETRKCDYSKLMKAIVYYLSVLLFIMLCKLVVTFESWIKS